MISPERIGVIKGTLNKMKKEGIVASVKGFGLELLGRTAIVGGVGLGFFGGEIAIAGKIIGFLMLTTGGAYSLVAADRFMDKAVSAFRQFEEVRAYVQKSILAKQSLIH